MAHPRSTAEQLKQEIAQLLDDIGFGLFPKKAHECHTALTYLPQPFKLSEAKHPLSVFLQVKFPLFAPMGSPAFMAPRLLSN
jgi:hypothetical protein